MCSIKFPGPLKCSMLFFTKFLTVASLTNYGKNLENFPGSLKYDAKHCTVVELSTRPNPLIISKFLQFRTFWSQTKALFIIRCTLSVESWFKTFRVQKWPYWVQNFEFLLHKITNFRGISGCQWTMPYGLFDKKSGKK